MYWNDVKAQSVENYIILHTLKCINHTSMKHFESIFEEDKAKMGIKTFSTSV